jgi:hypothetical protein
MGWDTVSKSTIAVPNELHGDRIFINRYFVRKCLDSPMTKETKD